MRNNKGAVNAVISAPDLTLDFFFFIRGQNVKTADEGQLRRF